MSSPNEEASKICTVSIDIPTLSPRRIQEEQLKDENIRKIIESFESLDKDENLDNLSDRDYLLNLGHIS